jgi:D-3-phosphoglycerate dehydrogenase
MLEEAGELRIASAPTADAILAEGLDADALVVRAPIPEEFFERAKKLRLAVRHGAGLDMIPLDAATKAGVLVANVPGANAGTVAEHVFFSAIALLRRHPQVSRDLRENGWATARAHSDRGHDLSGRSLGVVGFGAVGRAVARLGKAFGMAVSAFSRHPETLPEGVAFRPLAELFREADVLVLCVPLTAETRGMVSREKIFSMKPDAVLVNVARGPVMDEVALLEALQQNRILGAALDVFSEQPLPPGHLFLSLDNVVLTPHMAGITEESMARMGFGAAEEVLRVLRGELPKELRNPEAVERYRERFPPL